MVTKALFAKYLKSKIESVYYRISNDKVVGFYGIKLYGDITYDMRNYMPSYCDIYLVSVSDDYRFYDDNHNYSVEHISNRYAETIMSRINGNDFLKFEIWVVDGESNLRLIEYEKHGNKLEHVLHKLIHKSEVSQTLF